jgi:hypothetical protein
LTWRLKAGIKEQGVVAVAYHVSTGTNKHASVEELLEVVFSMWSLPKLYSEDPAEVQSVFRITSRLVVYCQSVCPGNKPLDAHNQRPSCIVKSHCLAMACEQTEDFMHAVVVVIHRV